MTTNVTELNTGSQSEAKVFISYSRKDETFAKWLREELGTRAIEIFRDVDDTLAGEEWWRRLQSLIAAADTIVFILSSRSVTSKVCRDEVAYADSLKKRIFPVVIEDVDWASVPSGLAARHSVFFTDKKKHKASLDQLYTALLTDIDWIREHTRLLERATAWERKGRGPYELLSSKALEEAERWLASKPTGAQVPTALHQEYVKASRDAAKRRRNILTISLGVGLAVALGLAALAYWQRGIAVEHEKVAQEQRTLAEEQRRLADEQRAAAIEQRDKALATQSRFLADLATQRVREGDAGSAMLLALEGLPETRGGAVRPYVPEAEAALDNARQNLREITILRGHENAVWSAAFSPDGQQVITGSDDKTARLWNASTGQETIVLRGHSGRVASVAFSPDGKRVLTGSWGPARLWDVSTGQMIMLLQGSAGVTSAAFSADGARLVAACDDGTTRIWDAASGQQIMLLHGHSHAVVSARFSRDGRRVVTASDDRTARLWDAGTGQQIMVLRNDFGGVTHAAFSPDGRRVVTAQGTVARLWDVEAGKEVVVLRGHEQLVWTAEFSPDGKQVLTASVDGTARLWDAESGENVAVLRGNTGIVLSAAFSPDGQRIVAASEDSTAQIWSVGGADGVIVLHGHEYKVSSAVFSPDAKRVLTASEDKTAALWNSDTGQQIMLFRGHEESVTSAEFSPSGDQVVTASLADNTVRVWDARTGQQTKLLRGFDHPYSATFSPDGTRLMMVSKSGVRLWSIAGQNVINILRIDVGSASFNPSGTHIITTSGDNIARLWDAESGQQVMPLRGYDAHLAAFSPDGNWIVTAARPTAQIWNAQTGQPVIALDRPSTDVNSVAFSPNSQRVVMALMDNTARILDAKSGKAIIVLRGHEDNGPRFGGMTRAAFSPDGNHVVTASSDATVRIWRSFQTTEQLVEHARQIIPRCLTRTQRVEAFLSPEPPVWCVEMHKWPYHTPAWNDWLKFKRADANPPLPDTPEWKSWLAALGPAAQTPQ
jgi:WD40 repeat protein/cell division protein FtsL